MLNNKLALTIIIWKTRAIHRKIPKISPRAYIFQRPFLRGLYSEGFIYGGKFAFQNRLGSKFIVFALLYFVFEGNFPSTSPRGTYIWRGDLTEGFFALSFKGAYIWRGLFSEFYGTIHSIKYLIENAAAWAIDHRQAAKLLIRE